MLSYTLLPRTEDLLVTSLNLNKGLRGSLPS